MRANISQTRETLHVKITVKPYIWRLFNKLPLVVSTRMFAYHDTIRHRVGTTKKTDFSFTINKERLYAPVA